MKLLSKPSEFDVLRIDYRGISLYVPAGTRAVATNASGRVVAFKSTPNFNTKIWQSGDDLGTHVAIVDLCGTKPEHTLARFN